VLKADPTENEISRLLERRPSSVPRGQADELDPKYLGRAHRPVGSRSIDAGERFAGVDGTEIEDTTDYKLMKEFIERVFEVSHASRAEILFSIMGSTRAASRCTLEKIGRG